MPRTGPLWFSGESCNSLPRSCTAMVSCPAETCTFCRPATEIVAPASTCRFAVADGARMPFCTEVGSTSMDEPLDGLSTAYIWISPAGALTVAPVLTWMVWPTTVICDRLPRPALNTVWPAELVLVPSTEVVWSATSGSTWVTLPGPNTTCPLRAAPVPTTVPEAVLIAWSLASKKTDPLATTEVVACASPIWLTA